MPDAKKHSIAKLSVNSRQHLELVSNDQMPVSRGKTVAMYPALHPPLSCMAHPDPTPKLSLISGSYSDFIEDRPLG